jgi:hypothetical protein
MAGSLLEFWLQLPGQRPPVIRSARPCLEFIQEHSPPHRPYSLFFPQPEEPFAGCRQGQPDQGQSNLTTITEIPAAE